jgi:hypothetical protein
LFRVSLIETTGIGAIQFNRKRWERACFKSYALSLPQPPDSIKPGA